MKKETEGILIVLFVCTLFISLIGIDFYRRTQYREMLDRLRASASEQTILFRIYPKASLKPSGVPISFSTTDPLVQDFFDALSEITRYSVSHNTVSSPDHQWFVEFTTEHNSYSLGCMIPVEHPNIVVGHLQHGDVQSQQLFKWYQQYKDRWLNPDTPNE